MHNQTITAAAMLAGYTSGSHPGPGYYAVWILIVSAIIALPIYLVRALRSRRSRR